VPLVIVTTAAGTSTNSYISTEEVDSLAAADVGRYAEGWEALTPDRKARAVLRATRDVDAYVGYLDTAYAEDQALLFPRGDDVDDDGLPYVPAAVVMATYEQAIYVAKVATLLDDADTREARGQESWSDGGVSGSQASPRMGQYAPRMRRYLDGPAVSRGGAVVGTIVLA
jgi:hypothetical protein